MNATDAQTITALIKIADRLDRKDTPTAFTSILADGIRRAASATTWQEWREEIEKALNLTGSAARYSESIGNMPDSIEEMHSQVEAVADFMEALEAVGTQYQEAVQTAECNLL
jgi:hypothetical protein